MTTHELCEDYKELLPANALTALDAVDARALDLHLRSCAACRSEMSEWEETAAFFALDATALEPSPQLRERILASVRAEGRVEVTNGSADAVNEPGVGTGSSKVLAFERAVAQRPRNIWASLGSLGAIAAALILAALIISLVVLWQKTRETQAELARLSTEMKLTKEQLDHERTVVQLLTSPDAHMAKLAGTNAAPDAHAMLAYDKNGHAMLMAKGLPAAPKGMAYQLWYIMGGKPMPGKMLTTDAAGNAILEDQIPAAALGGAVFAVTLEPEGGMPSPTGAIYLRSAA
jgi:anti-sigma-K factor RskA